MLSKSEKKLIEIQAIAFFIWGLSSVFLQVFIFKLKGLHGVVLYNLPYYPAVMIVYFASGRFLKIFSSRTLIRLGLFMSCISWLILLMLKSQAADYTFLMGILFGLAAGAFWSGYNLSQYILTSEGTRTNFFSRASGFANTASTLAPLFGGITIAFFNSQFNSEYLGYYVLFAIVAILSAYGGFIATSLPRHSGINFSLKHIIHHQRTRKWKYLLLFQFISGLQDIIFPVLSSILLFAFLQNEYSLGVVRTGMGLLSAGTGFALGQLAKKYTKIYLPGSIAAAIGIMVFIVFYNNVSLLLMMLLVGIGMPMLIVPTSVILLNTFDQIKGHWSDKYHLLIERDIMLGIARTLIFLLVLVLFVENKDIILVRQWLGVVAVCLLMSGGILFLADRQGRVG